MRRLFVQGVMPPPLFAIVLLLSSAMNAKAQEGFACPCTETGSINIDAGAGANISTFLGATTTNKCIAIRGRLIINQNSTLTNCELRMQPGAEIFMNANRHLNISDSDLSGCDTMWIGITLEQGRLTFDNNDISDAQWAIRWRCFSTLSQPCIPVLSRRMNVTNSRFDRNHIGIHVVPIGGVPFPSLSFTNTTSIHSDTFTCSSNLLPRFDAGLPNYQQTDAYAAMDINTTTNTFNIGSTNAAESILISSTKNNGIRNGIIARNCGTKFFIRNVDILDPVGGVGTGSINLASPEGIGILLESNTANVYIYDGTTLSSDRGIYAQGGFRLEVKGNVFTSDFIAFHIMGAAPNATIENNRFVEYEHNGVRAENANAIGTLIINSDTFLHSHPVFQNPTTMPNSTAVAIIGTNGTFGGSGNKVISNSIFDIDAQDVAINLLADARYSIINNNVAYGSGGSGFSNNQGIIHINGNDNFLYGNHIVEDVNTKSENSYSVIAGENVVLCCNTTERSVRGVYFEGNCDNSKLRHTGFGEHFRALFCNAATITGDQPFGANLWPTPPFPGTQNVEHLGGDTEVGGSEFFIPPPMAAPYWPDNIYTPNASVSWFISSTGTNPVCGSDEECAPSFLMLLGGGEEELTENNRVATEGGYEHERYGAMLTWETQRSLYAKLIRNPTLLEEAESIAGFYEIASGSAIGDFHAVWEAAKSIGRLTEEEAAAIEAFLLEIDAQQSLLLVIDALLEATENPEEIAELEADQEAILETLREINSGIYEILETEKARSEELAASLYTQNETLEAAILPAQNEKALNRVLFEMAAEGVQELNDEQFEVVAAIANQCPLDGGHSVYRARAIYERKQPGGFLDSLLCLQTQELARPGAQGFSAENNRTSVFPNPGANELSVRIPADLVGNTISLRLNTLTGQPALYFDRESAETLEKLDVSGQAAGVYLLTVRVDGQVIGTHKIILIK